MNSRDIIHAITRDLYSPHQLEVAYNTSGVTGWEADMLVLSRAGYLNEIEIKISVSDFKADFKAKADKHEMLLKGTAPKNYVDKNGKSPSDPGFVWKGSDIQRIWSKAKPHCVRHFWFAIPVSIKDKIEPLLPDYAGLIVVANYASIVKRAPILKMGRKATDNERIYLLRAMYHRGWKHFHAERVQSTNVDFIPVEMTERDKELLEAQHHLAELQCNIYATDAPLLPNL
jgi:hypothetical protein